MSRLARWLICSWLGHSLPDKPSRIVSRYWGESADHRRRVYDGSYRVVWKCKRCGAEVW